MKDTCTGSGISYVDQSNKQILKKKWRGPAEENNAIHGATVEALKNRIGG